MFAKLCHELTSELHILLKVPMSDVEKIAGGKIAEAIAKVRGGDIAIDPGFDGEFGKVKIWSEEEEKSLAKNTPQLSLEI